MFVVVLFLLIGVVLGQDSEQSVCPAGIVPSVCNIGCSPLNTCPRAVEEGVSVTCKPNVCKGCAEEHFDEEDQFYDCSLTSQVFLATLNQPFTVEVAPGESKIFRVNVDPDVRNFELSVSVAGANADATTSGATVFIRKYQAPTRIAWDWTSLGQATVDFNWQSDIIPTYSRPAKGVWHGAVFSESTDKTVSVQLKFSKVDYDAAASMSPATFFTAAVAAALLFL